MGTATTLFESGISVEAEAYVFLSVVVSDDVSTAVPALTEVGEVSVVVEVVLLDSDELSAGVSGDAKVVLTVSVAAPVVSVEVAFSNCEVLVAIVSVDCSLVPVVLATISTFLEVSTLVVTAVVN